MTSLIQLLTGNPNAGTSPIIRTSKSGDPLPQDTNNVAQNTNEFGFSLRLMEDLPISADYWQMLLILYMIRTPDGREWLKDMGKAYLKVLSETMGHLAQAGAANLITAWTHPILIANILEHNYMIASGAAGGMEESTQWIAGAMTASNVLSAIFGGKGFDVPATIIYATSGHDERMEMLRRMSRPGGGGAKKKANPKVDIEDLHPTAMDIKP